MAPTIIKIKPPATQKSNFIALSLSIYTGKRWSKHKIRQSILSAPEKSNLDPPNQTKLVSYNCGLIANFRISWSPERKCDRGVAFCAPLFCN